MSIDLSQFHDTFYEESFEGLDVMESGLLQLEQGEVDLENINTIFRSAHSIKGGSGTFGFTVVADFTHDMETLLDQMRTAQREVTLPVVNTLLACVDVLRGMLNAIKAGEEVDEQAVANMTISLQAILNGEEPASPASDKSNSPEVNTVDSKRTDEEATEGSSWLIEFAPYKDVMKTGNDTVRLMRELVSLADTANVELIDEKLPDLYSLDEEECHLSWKIKLSGSVISEEEIRDVFAWVDDECDLSIEKLVEPDDSQLTVEQAEPEKIRKVKPVEPVAVKKSRTSESSSIRVNISKVDELINMVGELVITQSMLSQFGENDEFTESHIQRLKDGLEQLESHTRELQESVMQIRMMPISFAFQRFPRLVHDLSNQFNKKIELIMHGESTELDRTVLEKIGDPLIHLVRNSLDHGIELPDMRVKAGKPETGTIELNAFHQGGNIVIEIKDDGAGLDKERILNKAIDNGIIGETERLSDEQTYDLIFQPGFSTAEVVSDVSGRGVGMDVVRRNIRELGGVVEVSSIPGEGSIFTIRLPLTLAILDGQLVGIGNETYILPVISIIESLQVKSENVNEVAGSAEVYRLREEYIPIVRLYELFGIEPQSRELVDGLIVVVEAEGKKIAIFVDELLGQQQVVIKSLETNFRKVEGVSGATILGNGTVALILDIAALIHLYQKHISGSAESFKGVA